MIDWSRWNLSHAVHGSRPRAVTVEAMSRSNGARAYGYFLEQGLFKTSLALNDWINSGIDNLVVFAPNSFKIDWTMAPAEWGIQGVDCRYWPKHPLPPRHIGKSVMAIHYEVSWRPAVFDGLMRFMSERPTFLVFDESSNAKNFAVKTGKACMKLAQPARMVRLLNGTPMTKCVMDYYPQLRMLGELNGLNPYAFRNKFARLGGYMGKQVVGVNDTNVEELYRVLDRCSFRALKRDWRADLPPQIQQTVHLEMTPTQREHYELMMEEFGTVIENIEVSVDLVLSQMIKLQQISSGILMQNDAAFVLEPWDTNPKIQAVLDIHDYGPGKTIVSYVYRKSGELLMEAASKAGLHPVWFKGQMNSELQNEVKRVFNEEHTCRMIIGQQQAMCMGHTLLGGPGEDRCNKLVFFENSFNLRDRLQMIDRNHRGEQDQECNVYDLCCSPMDAVPIAALQAKKNLADSIDAIVATVKRGKHERLLA